MTTNAKHTSGPWTAAIVLGAEHTHVVRGPGGEIVATVRRCTPADVEDHEGWGNTRLIAATLELFEAVQAFMALDPEFMTTVPQSIMEKMAESTGDEVEIARAVLKARAAIAKATGAAT